MLPESTQSATTASHIHPYYSGWPAQANNCLTASAAVAHCDFTRGWSLAHIDEVEHGSGNCVGHGTFTLFARFERFGPRVERLLRDSPCSDPRLTFGTLAEQTQGVYVGTVPMSVAKMPSSSTEISAIAAA